MTIDELFIHSALIIPKPERWLNGTDVNPFTKGVYVLLDENETAVYIGQSGNIAARLAWHEDDKSKSWTHSRYYQLDDKMSRLVLEGIMILLARPKYNRALNLGIRPDRVWEIKWSNRRKKRGGSSSSR